MPESMEQTVSGDRTNLKKLKTPYIAFFRKSSSELFVHRAMFTARISSKCILILLMRYYVCGIIMYIGKMYEI